MWSLIERAEFAAHKRHEFCRLLGGGCVLKGLHRLTLTERRAERLLDAEQPQQPTAANRRQPQPQPTAAPTPAPAAAVASASKRRRKRRTGALGRKRLQDFQQRKRAPLYAKCSLRPVLWRAIRSMRHSRLWKVHSEWKAAQPAALEANRDSAMIIEAAQPASSVLPRLQGLLSEPAAKRSRQPTGGEQEVLLPVAQITFKEAVARHGRGEPVSDAEKKAAIKSFWLDNPATVTCIPPWGGAVSRRLPRPGPAA